MCDVRRDEQTMDIFCERFRHLTSSNVCNSMQGQTVVYLVVLIQVLPDRVHD